MRIASGVLLQACPRSQPMRLGGAASVKEAGVRDTVLELHPTSWPGK